MVVPCYNEEDVLPETARRLREKMGSLIDKGSISEESRIMFVNDGSKDDTWNVIRKLHEADPVFQGLSLSRNRGHQNALLAGLMTAREFCDACVSMDADLQDDIDALDKMIEMYHDGCDVVYGVRNHRDTDSFFKRTTAILFYRLMGWMGVQMVCNHADYRLMSKRALNGLAEFREVNLFLRGIVPMIGYKTGKVYYDRAERYAGNSKYPLSRMLTFAMDGITSFSIVPIRMITALGIAVFFVSIIFLIWGIIQRVRGVTVPGWSSLIVSIWAIGGLILLALGILGEYIGRIYMETKGRPRFLIDEYLS